MKKFFALSLLAISGAAQAALVDRGGGFIYDDVLNVTWLQDANYAQTSGYDADGYMTWYGAMAWADGLSVYDSVRNVTYDDWRLPTTLQPDPTCTGQEPAHGGFPPQGYVTNCTGSEMGHLWNVDGVSTYSSGLFLFQFSDIWDHTYWSGTEYVHNTQEAWNFWMSSGVQDTSFRTNHSYAMAVRDGDVAASVVPIPAAVWLFCSGLGLLGWFRRRQMP